MGEIVSLVCDGPALSIAVFVLLWVSAFALTIAGAGVFFNIRDDARLRVNLFPPLALIWRGALTEWGVWFRGVFALSIAACLLFGGILLVLDGTGCSAPPGNALARTPA